MARYIDVETALKIIDNYAKTVTADGIVVVKAIRDIVEIITPTADVVPKSEVESIITLNSQLEAQAFEQQKEIESLKKSIFPSYSQAIGEEAAIKIGEEYGKQEAKEEIQKLNVELDAMRGAANSLKMHYEKAEAEVKRLRGILLQFTDIVHKWGAKNNIDTTEISLVPILQEEADSIIKKANQELEAEIDRLKHILNCYALQYGTVKEQQDVIDKANQAFAGEIFANLEKLHLHITNNFDLRRYNELKKKYTGYAE